MPKVPIKPLSSDVPRTAVFIDGDWFIHATRRVDVVVDYRRLATALRETFGTATSLSFFASIDELNEQHRVFVSSLKSAGFVVETVPIKRRQGQAFSKGLDVLLSVRAATLPPEFDRLVLVSGDNDFVPLLLQAQGAGRSTVLVAFPLLASSALSDAATRFVSLEEFLKAARVTESTASAAPDDAPSAEPPDEFYIEKGEHFEPYRLLRGLFMAAKRELTIIDPYINDQIFEMMGLISPTVAVSVFTDKIQAPDFRNLVAKLRLEGRSIRLYRTKDFHDRFLRVDEEWWHSGHSLKDLGTKDSRLSKVNNSSTCERLRERECELLGTATELCP